MDNTKTFMYTEDYLNIYNAGIAGIKTEKDLYDYLHINFEMTTRQTEEFKLNLLKYPYRNNKYYLRFLASVLIMAAEFGYEFIVQIILPSSSLRQKVEKTSCKDFLDPRNLVNLAIYLGGIIVQMQEFRIKYLADLHYGMSEETFVKFLAGWLRPSHGNLNINQDIWKNPYTLLQFDRFDESFDLDEQQIYIADLGVAQSLSKIQGYDLNFVEKMTRREFEPFLIQLEQIFPGIYLRQVFEDEFTYNP